MKTNKLNRALQIVVVTLIFVLASMFTVACKPKEPDKGTAVDGVYYYDGEGQEYTFDLNGDFTFSLNIKGKNITGNYTYLENVLELDVKEKITVQYSEAEVKVQYEGSEMTFIKKVDYTVSFDTAGGSAISPVTVRNGKTVAKPASDPTLANAAFEGWYADSAYTKAYNFSTPITGNTTLYAKFIMSDGRQEFNVAFDLGYEAQAPAAKTTINGKLYDVTEPERTGYTFQGWWISSYGEADKLSYIYTNDLVFEENTTLYALWQENGAGVKAPVVNVEGDIIKWNTITGVTNYNVNITGPNDYSFASVDQSTTKAIEFSKLPAGDYVITITANTNSGSATTVRYYKNKPLARVSIFNVVDNQLNYNAVKNAEKYSVMVECGNPLHNHVAVDNGASTNFNFANCAIGEDGIKFTITASAEGFASSVAEYVYNNVLGAAQLTFNANTETVSWNAVAGASEYIVTVNGEEVYYGKATSYSVKNYNPAELVIGVTPVAEYSNSPAEATYTYNKQTLATPANIKVVNDTLSWDAVEGATGYTVKVNGVEKPATKTSMDLNAYTWSGKDVKISVKANGATSSVWSDEINALDNEMSAQLEYAQNTVSWRMVVGAAKYFVKVNGIDVAQIVGENATEVTLTKAGDNVIEVRYFDGREYSDWASITVTAYEFKYDARSGAPVATQYYATGDYVELPTTTRDGYDFAGWYNIADGANENGKEYTFTIYNGDENITLYANWTPQTYQISYHYGQYGINEEEFGYATYTKEFTLRVPASNDELYVFAGWYSQPGGNGVMYTDKYGKSYDIWTSTQGATVYAHWLKPFNYEYIERPNGAGYRVKKGPDIGLIGREITVPETYNGLPVMELGSYSFGTYNSLHFISIPDSLSYIDLNAFANCSWLEDITMYRTANTYGDYWTAEGILYEYDRVAEGTIGKTILKVPQTRTGTLTIVEGINSIGSQAFWRTELTTIIIPASVTRIGENAFKEGKIEEVIFAEATETCPEADFLNIYTNAFYSCKKLTEITFPARLSSLGREEYDETELGYSTVFASSENFSDINVKEGGLTFASSNGMLTNADGTEILYCPINKAGVLTIPQNIRTVADNVFNGLKRITEVVIPGWVTNIGNKAFYNCDRVTKVTFKSGGSSFALEIGSYAFAECNNLAEIVFETNSNVKTIGEYAFANCRRITEVTVHKATEVIGAYAFSGCTGIRTFTIEEGKTAETPIEIGNRILANCSSLTAVNLPARVETFPEAAFYGCDYIRNFNVSENNPNFLEEDGLILSKDKTQILFSVRSEIGEDFVIPEGVTYLGAGVFKNNLAIKTITIDSEITHIGSEAFLGCSNLATVIIEDGGAALKIGDSAFANCTSLNAIEIPSRTSSLGVAAFKGCTSLSTISIKAGTTINSLANEVFKNTNISTFEFPATVKSIGSNAFENTKITVLNIPGTVQTIGSYAFKGCNITSLTLNEGLKSIGSYFMQNNKNITSLTVPSTVYSIGDYAFDGTAIAELNFPVSETGLTIGQYAFRGIAITTLAIPDRVTQLSNYAFQNNKQLQSVTSTVNGKLSRLGSTSTGQVFAGCTALTSIKLMSPALNYVATKIALDSPLTEVVFNLDNTNAITFEGSDGSKSSYNQSFAKATITSIDLPANIAKFSGIITAETFTAYNIKNGGTGVIRSIDGIAYACDAEGNPTKVAALPNGKTGTWVVPITMTTMGNNAPYGGTHIEEIVFEGSATATSPILTLNYQPFAGMEYLKKIKLPARSSELTGTQYFWNCKSLETVEFEDNMTITSFATNMFSNSGIKKVIIPHFIESIGSSAFANCPNLTEVIFETDENGNSSLRKIGASAFANSPISNVILPDSVQEIGANAFQNSGIKTLRVPANLTNIGTLVSANLEDLNIDNCIFYEKDENGIVFGVDEKGNKTSIVYYPATLTTTEYNIPEGITTIGELTFSYNEHLTKVTVPASVTLIGTKAFTESPALETVEIAEGSSELIIDSNAFYGSGLKSINLPARTADMGTYVFAYCTNLEEVTFSEGILLTEIPDYTFRGSTVSTSIPSTTEEVIPGLKRIVIPASIVRIGNYAFYNCKNLESVTFEEGNKLATLGYYAFAYCESLTSIDLPVTVTNLGSNSTFRNSGLESIVIPEGVEKLPNAGFMDCVDLKTVVLPSTLNGYNSATSSYYSTVLIDPATNKYQVFKKVPAIFVNCPSLETVNIPASLEYVSDYMFYGCTNLKNLEIEEGIMTIGNYAFYGASSIEKIEFPMSLQNTDNRDAKLTNTMLAIGDYAFYGAENLKQIFMLDGDVEVSIGTKAFYNCGKLETLKLPSNMGLAVDASGNDVAAIGSEAFYGCALLKEINLPSTALMIGSKAFYGCESITELDIDYGIDTIGDYAFYGATNLETLTISSSVRILGENPFFGACNVKNFSLNDANTDLVYVNGGLYDINMTTLYWFFPEHEGGKVVLPESVRNICAGAFYGCTNVTEVVIPSAVTVIKEYAFYGSGITTVTIGKNVTTIGAYAFANCESLAEVIFEESDVQKKIDETAFDEGVLGE